MTVESISNGNLRIWLAENEMEEWGLTDHHPKGVRRLVRQAMTMAGRCPTTRAWVEMIPVDGGWVVLISTQQHSRTRPMVYAVEERALAEVTARWRPSAGDGAQVYAVEGGYHVVVYSDAQQSDALLREYGRPLGCGEAVAAHTAEYGTWVLTMPEPEPPEPEDLRH